MTYADNTCSYEVIPYLLALLEEWEETEIEEDIRMVLEDFLAEDDDSFEDMSVNELGEIYMEYTDKIDMVKYYYNTKLTFIGDLTKILVEGSFIARQKDEMLKQEIIPSILSIWSGIECPASYYTVVDDEVLASILNYVDKMSKIDWEKGKKYFYGHIVA